MSINNLTIKKRLIVILFIFSALFFLLLVRVAWIQFYNGEAYSEMAYEQHNRDREITPKRGTIFERNGKELAVSATVSKIIVSPVDLKKDLVQKEKIAEQLANMLSMKKEDVFKKLIKKSRYEVLKRKVDNEVAHTIIEWRNKSKLTGIYADEDTKRFYPNRNLAAHIIGFTGTDNQGLYGIEMLMEQHLKGMPGKILSEVDGAGKEVPFNEEKRIEPQDGLNVVLSIDETIQYFVQKELDRAIEENNVVNGAAAIVMDPNTGDILALVSKPDFDSNDPKAAPKGVDIAKWTGTTNEDIKYLQSTVWRDKAVTDTYEPGSTFKAFTSAAGLEEGVVTSDTPTSDRTINVGGWDINCWKPNAHGNEPFYMGVYNSCNPVFVKVAQGLGIEKFYKYVRAFGFYNKTNISLPGEAGSQFHAKPTEVNMATASFGQRFQITPIQLISGYCAIANGGKLMKPRLIKELTNSQGNIIKKYEPEVIRDVISRKTSETLRNILQGVVSDGTGKNAYVKGYRVAGKTGTSETLESGHYIASFSAMAPAENPAICVLVILDNPTGGSYYGGVIAAPVAGRIVEQTLNYLGVEKKYSEKDKEMLAEEVAVPDMRGKTFEEAKKKMEEIGLQVKLESKGESAQNIIIDQMPKPSANIPKRSLVILYNYKPEVEIAVAIPNLKGVSMKDAVQILNNIGLNIRISGTGLGYAAGQSRLPGERAPKGSIIEVEFRNLETD